MRATIVAALIAASPSVAIAQAMPGYPTDVTQPVRIVIDNRAPCFGGRIGQMRENNARMTAKQEARRLRKLGFTVETVTLSAGMDRSQRDIGARIFTAIC